MKKNALAALYEKDGTKKVLSSLISIVAGLLVGGIAVLIVGLCNEKISLSGAWDGIRIIFAGIFSTGRDAAGTLTWGFNAVNLGNMLFRATPLIMTGLSVAVAFKTGLFNIGAPGQYLISTMATLMIALSIPSSSVPTWIIWILAFLGGCLAGGHSINIPVVNLPFFLVFPQESGYFPSTQLDNLTNYHTFLYFPPTIFFHYYN